MNVVRRYRAQVYVKADPTSEDKGERQAANMGLPIVKNLKPRSMKDMSEADISQYAEGNDNFIWAKIEEVFLPSVQIKENGDAVLS